MHQRLQAVALAVALLVPLTSCVGDDQLAELRGIEAQAREYADRAAENEAALEDNREVAEALPEGTPSRDAALVAARAAELEAEAILAEAEERLRVAAEDRANAEAFSRKAWYERGLSVVVDGARQDWSALLATLGATATAALALGLRKLGQRVLPPESFADLERRLADSEARRERLESNLRLQRIATSEARSAEAAASPVRRAIDAIESTRTPQAPGVQPLAPAPHRTPQAAAHGHRVAPGDGPAAPSTGPEAWSQGAGVPTYELPS